MNILSFHRATLIILAIMAVMIIVAVLFPYIHHQIIVPAGESEVDVLAELFSIKNPNFKSLEGV